MYNVIMVLADQHHAGLMGCSGHKQAKTPNFDKFAENGIRNPEKPFFIKISYQKPHHPLLPQQKFLDLYDEDLALPETSNQEPGLRPPHFRKVWDQFKDLAKNNNEDYEKMAKRMWRGTLACISQIDDVFGKMIEAIKERGLMDKTIIIYSSDHGCYHTIHGIPEKAPGICSDSVCRVPMIWHVPGNLKKGNNCSELVESVDIAPTLCSLCKIKPMDTVDGKDITNLLNGQNEQVHEVAVTENPWSKSLRWGKWRFVHYQSEMFNGEDTGELYNMEIDPDETNNLYYDSNYKKQVEDCRRKLLEWLISSTRCRTIHPPEKREQTNDKLKPGRFIFKTSEDGKEANTSGAQERLKANFLNYL